jgi:hypothetical protein
MRIISIKHCDHAIENEVCNFKTQNYSEDEIEGFITKRLEKLLSESKEYNEAIAKLHNAYKCNDIKTYRNISLSIHLLSKKILIKVVSKYIKAILEV